MSVSERTVHLQMLNHASTQNDFAMTDPTERPKTGLLASGPLLSEPRFYKSQLVLCVIHRLEAAF